MSDGSSRRRSPRLAVRLVDDADEPGRTTASLVASLAARLATLHLVSGADAVGSLVAGFAALGRAAARTAEGARLRTGIEQSRAASNGEALWKALLIDRWASSLPPSPVLEDLRNDLALVLAEDLEASLDPLPMPGEPRRSVPPEDLQPATFLDCALGLWVFGRELAGAVEILAQPNLVPPGAVLAPPAQEGPREGPLLR